MIKPKIRMKMLKVGFVTSASNNKIKRIARLLQMSKATKKLSILKKTSKGK